MAPFVAEPRSFSTIELTWNDPAGTWSGFRLVRNRAGYPVSETDGTLLLSAQSDTDAPLSFFDTALSGGWYYYAIFLFNSARNAWERAGQSDAVIPFDYKSKDLIWSSLPDYYRSVRDTAADYSQALFQINPAIYLSKDQTVPNEQLEKFISVFGWGVNILRSQIDGILDGYNTRTAHVNRIALLANQFGSTVETSVPAENNRNLVRNMGLLYRKRGTVEGIEETLRLATGWEVEVSLGANMMLNKDQSEFTSPAHEEWDSTVAYDVGAIVKKTYANTRFYRALVVSLNREPANLASTTYWELLSFTSPFIQGTLNRNPRTGDYSTWRTFQDEANPNVGKTWMALGVPAPANVDNATNVLEIHNDGSFSVAINTLNVLSIPITSTSRAQEAIDNGIPIPAVFEWRNDLVYGVGEAVKYRGIAYEAIQTTTAVPTDVAEWQQVGFDSRLLLGVSAFLHGPFGGAVGGGLKAKPLVYAFDEHGKELLSTAVSPPAGDDVVYDPFNKPGALTTTRTTTLGSKTWGSSVVGSLWQQSIDGEEGIASPVDAGVSYTTINSTSSNGRLGITFKSIPPNRELGIIFRHSDASNYWSVTNKAIYRTVAGVRTAQVNWPVGTFGPGDRLIVAFNAVTMTVNKFNSPTALYSRSDTLNDFNKTATGHGLISWSV